MGRGTFVAEKKRPVPDDVWARQLHMHEVRTPGVVSLFSPRLADVGQVAAVRDALRQVADGPPLPLMSYPTRDAYTPVRQAVAGWLSDRMLGPLDEQDVVLTHGGQHGLCLAMQAILTGSKPAVLVEDLSYAGFRRAAEQLRADVAGVAINEQGLRPDMLELAARTRRWNAARKSSPSAAATASRSSRMTATAWARLGCPATGRWRRS